MKTFKHIGNIVSVSFPNGQERKRNCSTTVVPDDRLPVDHAIPSLDLYSNRDYTKMATNSFIKTDVEKSNSRLSIAAHAVSAIVISWALYIFFCV